MDKNKLLADFMEIPTQYVEREYHKPEVLEIVNPTNPSGNLTGIPYQPDKDWNQLMSIVRKINDLADLDSDWRFILETGDYIMWARGCVYIDIDIWGVYKEAVEFVTKINKDEKKI